MSRKKWLERAFWIGILSLIPELQSNFLSVDLNDFKTEIVVGIYSLLLVYIRGAILVRIIEECLYKRRFPCICLSNHEYLLQTILIHVQ